jgi:hypothetical protein
MLLFGLLAAPAKGEIFYDISTRIVYEDNVVGLLSDESSGSATARLGPMAATIVGAMGAGPGPGGGSPVFYTGTSTGPNSDMSIDVIAELGGSVGIGKNAALFLSGAVERLSYETFRELNLTASGASAGLTWQLIDSIAARISANGMIKRFKDPARDSSAYGGSLLFKERLSSRFWLKEIFAYEQNRAEAAYFSYDGNTVAFWAGYDVADRTTLLAGYNYVVREYEEPLGFKEKANTFSLALELGFLDKWYLDLQYDRRASDSNIAGTDTTGNIFTLGIRYSY